MPVERRTEKTRSEEKNNLDPASIDDRIPDSMVLKALVKLLFI